MTDELAPFFAGEKLYGDDFSLPQIEQWYRDEAEGYANLGAKNKKSYQYSYHQLNILHGFKHLSSHRFHSVLGLGSAYGDEFLPIASQIDKLTIVDPSDAFQQHKECHGIPCQYVKPVPSGQLPFEDNAFSLITSLGVLHHIPNVSYVVSECFRCLEPNGIMLLREPIVSMGDWRKPRNGLTKRERGIPMALLDQIVTDAGFCIERRQLCVFPALARMVLKCGMTPYNMRSATAFDAFLSKVFAWNITYHRRSFIRKLAPASVYYILKKA
jgi:SAM-dependent methyltransferase